MHIFVLTAFLWSLNAPKKPHNESEKMKEQPHPSRWVRFAEIFFSGVAKATMAVVAIVGIILVLLSGDLSGIGAPTSRKDFYIFLLIILAVVLCAILVVLANQP